MRTIEISLRTRSVSADDTFALIKEFDRYPDLVDEVRRVTVRERSDGHLTSDWEVYFRNGPLRWEEVDYIEEERLRILFEQLSGDFQAFRGSWQVTPEGGGAVVTFEATFDFGIPSLAGVLEPIAAKVLKEGIAVVVYRLLGGVDVISDPAVEAAVHRVIRADDNSEQLAAS
ncbi:type II toxin-antitoxin system RatA family toxin [Nocardia fluminea]|jgi:ribosome-associated toxin RatA of RatAB toxin-antitoxin module|uniref:type II toxin-antitoxin system RatA family toxin n=1 Tax=Nocardia fluminea TaxID=134984 RepID=UPI0036722975